MSIMNEGNPPDYGQQGSRPPGQPLPPPPAPRGRLSVLESLLLCTRILVSLATLVFIVVLIAITGYILLGLGSGVVPPAERHYSGKAGAAGKVAVVRIDGLLFDGMMNFTEKQLDEAGADKDVKAVVIRVNSPGGSISASDDLHRRITELRNGNTDKKIDKKKVVVSMGGIAASGGCYISMPAEKIYAERTTLTGSIGVIAAFWNLKGLGDKYGVHVEVIKAGEVKDSGSMFRDMTAEDRQLYQELIDNAFNEFIIRVEEGRKDRLKVPLRKVIVDKPIDDRGSDGKIKPGDGKVTYKRCLADGGIWTAQDAKEWGLIDDIGYLDDAIGEAKNLAGLSADAKVIIYDRPPGLLTAFTGVQAPEPGFQLNPSQLAAGMTPRIWYLAPNAELAGILTSMGH